MFILVDERPPVVDGYETGFDREGVPLTGFAGADFDAWLRGAASADLRLVQGFLLGDFAGREHLPRVIRERSSAPMIAVSETPCLQSTLELFAAGVDDVVRKPVHVRELLARADAIRRRGQSARQSFGSSSRLCIHHDGRDPDIDGTPFPLPRRERRILEVLDASRDRRLTKEQIFNAVYGLFEDHVQESVIESHISKLRKKLYARMGYDPIDSKRFLGYRLAP